MEVTDNVTAKEKLPYIYKKEKMQKVIALQKTDESICNTDFLMIGKNKKKRNKCVANISSIRYNKSKGTNVRQIKRYKERR